MSVPEARRGQPTVLLVGRQTGHAAPSAWYFSAMHVIFSWVGDTGLFTDKKSVQSTRPPKQPAPIHWMHVRNYVHACIPNESYLELSNFVLLVRKTLAKLVLRHQRLVQLVFQRGRL